MSSRVSGAGVQPAAITRGGDMQKRVVVVLGRIALATVLVAGVAYAQQMPPHNMPMGPAASSQPGVPTSPGQGAFGAIQEIVRILDEDPATDWSKVSLDASASTSLT